MNKKLRKVASYFIEQARSSQREIHSQWFYFQQDNSQPAHRGTQLLNQHALLETVIEGLNTFIVSFGDKTPRGTSERMATRLRTDLAAQLSLMGLRMTKNEEDSEAVLAAWGHIDNVSTQQLPSLSLLKTEDSAA